MNAKELMERIEGKKWNMIYWFSLFMGIVLARNLIEGFLEAGHELMRIEWLLLQYPLFYASIFLSYLLLLFVFSRERIERISKIMLMFFSVIILVPLIDFIVSGGKGYAIGYWFGGVQELAGKAMLLRELSGAPSVGQVVVVLLGAVLAAIYVVIKESSYLKGVITGIGFYIITVFYACLPMLLLIGFFGEGRALEFIQNDQKLFLLGGMLAGIYLFLIILQLLVLGYVYSREKLLEVLRNVRPLRALHYVLMVVIGVLLAINFSLQQINWSSAVFLCFSVFFAFQGSAGLNDFFDRGIDVVSNKERVLVKGVLTEREYKALIGLFFLLSVLFASIVGVNALILLFFCIALSVIYSVPPFRLKKFVLINGFVLALISLNCIFLGFAVQGIPLVFFPREIILLVLVVFTLGMNFKDLKDYSGDSREGIHNLLTLFGERNGKKVIGGMVFISYLLVPFILNELILLPFAVVFGSANFFFALKNREKLILLSYFLFVLIVIAFY